MRAGRARALRELIAIRVQLMFENHLLGDVGYRLIPLEADWCETLATDNCHLFYNPDFPQRMSKAEALETIESICSAATPPDTPEQRYRAITRDDPKVEATIAAVLRREAAHEGKPLLPVLDYFQGPAVITEYKDGKPYRRFRAGDPNEPP